MRVQRKSNGQLLSLGDHCLLGSGGEARIYVVPQVSSLAAKIWHKPTLERARKLRAMLANPPSDPMIHHGHISIAWPTDLLQTPDQLHIIVGFLMARVTGMNPIIDFFNPKTRRRKCPLFNYFYLHRTARNLAIAVRALHERGYVIGDLNESNILVSDTALVTLVDTDSFQVWDAENGQAYRCRVGKPEFTPPELQGRPFAQFDREPAHDLFGLSVILFQLLMEGTHPYAGAFNGKGDPPPYEARIRVGHFPHAKDPRVPYVPKPTAPSFDMLHPSLQHLFIRCFQDGYRDPGLRPVTLSWQCALEEAENALVTCWINPQHIYSGHLDACPWCARTKSLGGRDPFPTPEAVKVGQHLREVRRPATSPQPQRPGYGSAGYPPIPKPIPSSKSSTSSTGIFRPRPYFGSARRNDWAWTGLVVGLVALSSGILLPRSWAALSLVLGLLALLLGSVAEIQSRSWSSDGQGSCI
ncbi:MAG: hypothetical protein M1608_08635, partial [Candidatus Omnitrophica bacterium]|nr:hypothetical protein [Candidatus Omnitrophota bacterium]